MKREATHLPVLAAIARARKIVSVVEFGSGMFSTSSFLDVSIFPDLVSIKSYEDDDAWANKVSGINANDDRLSIKLVIDYFDMANHVDECELRQADLVFVDCSDSEDKRVVVLGEVCHALEGSETILVVHDYEIASYRSEVDKREFDTIVFNTLRPNTGVCVARGRGLADIQIAMEA